MDGYRLSTFLVKDRDSVDDRLKMGPVWDFNPAFGNADYNNGWLSTGRQLTVSIPNDLFQAPFWWLKLMANPLYRNHLARRWHTLRGNVLQLDSLFRFIDESVLLFDESQQRNFIRWPVLGVYVWANAFVGQTYTKK